jgi:tRNA pseudouridine38-40 synthase
VNDALDAPALQRVRIDLAYDGTPFYGFARQRERPTVQGALEGALRRLIGQDVVITCAGRTDRGVHAMGQVVHVDVDLGRDQGRRFVRRVDENPDRERFRLDRLVGDAVTIWRVAPADLTFDARFSATQRRYRYVLVDGPTIDPRRRTQVWHLGEPLALRAMQQGAKHLLGDHDFASFCRKAAGKHTRRRIDRITVARAAPGEIHVRLDGPAFCHQQVRSIVGCLVEIGHGRHDPTWMGEVLVAADRSVAARVAPPHGLTLEEVVYGRRRRP